MSDLFMQMHQRRLSEAGGSATRTSSRSTSAYTSPERRSRNGSTPHEEDPLANILRVQLKKPAQWRWELSTSRSASNIALPRIMLYDHKGTLLVDADTQEEKVYSQAALPPPASSTTSGTKRHIERPKRAATTNLTHSIRQALEREFTDLQISDTYLRSCSASPLSAYSALSGSAIDFNSNELPDEHRSKSRSHSHSLKVRFKDDPADDEANTIVGLPTPPSTSTTTINTTPGTSSSSGPREKRRYRRSRSSGGTPSGSPSILERFSFTKGRMSSPEYAEEHEVHHGPRYILRSSKAGTLVVQEESFSRAANCRRRRRPRNSSAENIASGSVSKCQSMSSLKGLPTPRRALLSTIESVESRERSASLQNVTQDGQRGRRKLQPIRRFRSDGNVLLHKQLSTSDEEAAPAAATAIRRPYVRSKQHLHNGDIIGAPRTNGYDEGYGYGNQQEQAWRQRF